MSDQVVQAPYTPSEVRILLVDDNPKNIKMLGSVLRDEGFQIIAAVNGEQALKAAVSHTPHIILLDVMMPGLDGYGVIAELKKDAVLSNIPVIFITALSDEQDEEKGLNLGAVDYIAKPINIPIALARIRTHLALAFASAKLREQNKALIQAAELRDDVERITRHDLKSPLTAVIGYPAILLGGGGLTSQQADLIERIRAAGRRLHQMIDSSLNLFKMEIAKYEFAPEAMNLVETANSVINDLKLQAARCGVVIELVMDGQPVGEGGGQSFEIQGEPLLYYSILTNLVKNAIEASPKDATVSIQLLSGAKKTINIRNAGEVPEEIRAKFFDKYVTSGKKSGTGLGTYSARLMTETQGGEIQLISSEPGYTSIRLTVS